MTESMPQVLDGYSNEEFVAAFTGTLRKLLAKPSVCTHERPCAILLGGQSGAEKTTLHKIMERSFSRDVLIINGDEFRKSHPYFQKLDDRYGTDAVSHTSAWSGQMTETLIDKLSQLGYNLVVDGTLRTVSVPLKMAELLRSRGYEVSLALMAVKPEISLLSCQLRYETMRNAGTMPRATDPKHHRQIVEKIVGNLRELESSGMFKNICLYTRLEECLYPADGEERSASDVLQDVLFGPWTQAEEQHREDLKERLALLRHTCD